ncbi:hypothetical protein VNO77_29498 [Canavalia gladiata]|uniref:Uncharacterized protein n=1 Tax=Canavalia gladiata TaxID=3824 RepID=A0AAN9KXV9_CANGL
MSSREALYAFYYLSSLHVAMLLSCLDDIGIICVEDLIHEIMTVWDPIMLYMTNVIYKCERDHGDKPQMQQFNVTLQKVRRILQSEEEYGALMTVMMQLRISENNESKESRISDLEL